MNRSWAGIGPMICAGVAVVTAGCSPDAVSNEPPEASADAGADGSANGSTFTGDAAAEAAPEEAGGNACVPVGLDAALPPYVPARAPQSVCTATQILAYYDACFAGAGGTACSDFEGDPANSPCIECMGTASTRASWGAVINFPDVSVTNVAGCIALVDGDAGPGSCAAAAQALVVCQNEACSSGCPGGASGFPAFQTCETLSRATVCSAYVAPAQCDLDSAYAGCIFVSFESSFRGIGQIFCGAGMDAGSAVLDAGSTTDGSADGAPDGGADAAGE